MTKIMKKTKKKDKKEAFLVVSDNFVEKYRRCKKRSCMTKKNYGLFQFYNDNGCLIATIEDKDKKVYGRTILWGEYYDEIYVQGGYKRAFNKLLKGAGITKTKGRAIYPIKKMGNMPFLDGFANFNIDFTCIANYNDEKFCLTHYGYVPDKGDELKKTILYRCPCCQREISLAKAISKTGFRCPDCKEDKIKLVKKFLKEMVGTIETKAGVITIKPLDILNDKGKKYIIFRNGDAEITKRK